MKNLCLTNYRNKVVAHCYQIIVESYKRGKSRTIVQSANLFALGVYAY